MAKLVKDNRLSSQEDILSSLQYNIDIGDFAQVCKLSSIVVYDSEYHKKQYFSGRKWGEDDVYMCLPVKPPQQHQLELQHPKPVFDNPSLTCGNI